MTDLHMLVFIKCMSLVWDITGLCYKPNGDHNGIILRYRYDVAASHTKTRALKSKTISWHKLNHENIRKYQDACDAKIDTIVLPTHALSCNNVHCENGAHLQDLSMLCSDLIAIALNAGDTSFPVSSGPSSRKAGWNEYVKPHREDALFWHRLWVECGRPPTGALAMVMRHTRCQYHRAVREIKRNQLLLKRVKLGECASSGSSRELWAEINKLNGAKMAAPDSIEGHMDELEVANLFAEKYRQLFNSNPSDPDDVRGIRDKIETLLHEEHGVDYEMNVQDLNKALRLLNSQKSDGFKGTYSEHFIYASQKYNVVLSMMINCMLTHGYSPDDLLIGALVPIPKDLRGNLTCSDNYRGIALCSAIGKLIDYIILHKYHDILRTSDLQFAYKSDHSTTLCTVALKEVISYYTSKGSRVYALLLDASKAFDRINHGKLFQLLLKRKLPAVIVRFLWDSYTRQKLYVKWNTTYSDTIEMVNGVKQGGVLSATLFCVYMDELLFRLQSTRVGCHIGHIFYGAFSYADDLKLLSPSITGLQKMIYVCEEFSKEFSVTFNAKKTVAICYGCDGIDNLRTVRLGGTFINWVKRTVYLGNVVTNDNSDVDDILWKKGKFIGSINKLNAQFGIAPFDLKMRLLNTYCSSWYGCQTWRLDTAAARQCRTEWNKAVRRTLCLPCRTRTALIPGLSGAPDLGIQFEKRWCTMFSSMLHSKNINAKYLACLALVNTRGNLGKNRVYISLKYGIREFSKTAHHCMVSEQNEEVNQRVSVIKELLSVRDNSSFLPMFQNYETSTMIDHMCVY